MVNNYENIEQKNGKPFRLNQYNIPGLGAQAKRGDEVDRQNRYPEISNAAPCKTHYDPPYPCP